MTWVTCASVVGVAVYLLDGGSYLSLVGIDWLTLEVNAAEV